MSCGPGSEVELQGTDSVSFGKSVDDRELAKFFLKTYVTTIHSALEYECLTS